MSEHQDQVTSNGIQVGSIVHRSSGSSDLKVLEINGSDAVVSWTDEQTGAETTESIPVSELSLSSDGLIKAAEALGEPVAQEGGEAEGDTAAADDTAAAGEPASDEPASDEPASDEPASDEPAQVEPAADAPAPSEQPSEDEVKSDDEEAKN